MRINLNDKKYTYVRNEDGSQSALRYGKPWRNLTGDNFIFSMAQEIKELKQRIAELDAAGKDMALALTKEPYEDKQCMACGADDTEWNGQFMAFVHEDGCPTLVFQQPDSGEQGK